VDFQLDPSPFWFGVSKPETQGKPSAHGSMEKKKNNALSSPQELRKTPYCHTHFAA
jgi:hypothetical protein